MDNALPDRFKDYLQHAGIAALNPMQERVLEHARTENDLLVLSPTGSGKTLAFLLSCLEHTDPENRHLQNLVVCPTRELALQIEESFRKLKTGLKVTSCYGGHSISTEAKSLSEIPAVLIGTPGRIIDHIHRGNIFLSTVSNFVIDEFDKCLEFGFREELETIHDRCSNLKLSLLTSATDLRQLPAFMEGNNFLKLDFRSEEALPEFEYFRIEGTESKETLLIRTLDAFSEERNIVFCNLREEANTLSELFKAEGIVHSLYHGGLEQEERERALLKFRNGSSRILLCTDIGARGLDIPEVRNIIHLALPDQEASWVHRNGRTARMSAEGSVFLFPKDLSRCEYIDKKGFKPFHPPKAERKQPELVTLYISAGRKNKISKGDIAGFLIKTGGLSKEDVGLIEVRDFQSFVAVPRKKIRELRARIDGEKLKGKKQKIEIAY